MIQFIWREMVATVMDTTALSDFDLDNEWKLKKGDTDLGIIDAF
jgi:hypothetical protein